MGGSTMHSNSDLLNKIVDPSVWPNTPDGVEAREAMEAAVGEATKNLSTIEEKVAKGKRTLSLLKMGLSFIGV